MPIPLTQLLGITDTQTFKLHLACWNGEDHPLDVFIRDRDEWDKWSMWRSTKDEFNRPRILAMAQFYHEPDTWLLAGVYDVLSRGSTNHDYSYGISRVEQYEPLIGRVKATMPRPGRAKAFLLENYAPKLTVSEILPEKFAGIAFPGYENLSHDFGTLEVIFRNVRMDWKAALQHVKGVYLVSDVSNGRKYVGSAYGGDGLWSRWSTYMQTGHGWNDELTHLISEKGIEYARVNFTMTLLEYRPAKTDDMEIIARENFWKEALGTRGAFGYNRN